MVGVGLLIHTSFFEVDIVGLSLTTRFKNPEDGLLYRKRKVYVHPPLLLLLYCSNVFWTVRNLKNSLGEELKSFSGRVCLKPKPLTAETDDEIKRAVKPCGVRNSTVFQIDSLINIYMSLSKK